MMGRVQARPETLAATSDLVVQRTASGLAVSRSGSAVHLPAGTLGCILYSQGHCYIFCVREGLLRRLDVSKVSIRVAKSGAVSPCHLLEDDFILTWGHDGYSLCPPGKGKPREMPGYSFRVVDTETGADCFNEPLAAGSAGLAPFVSVVVPVYNDARAASCVHALSRQTYPGDRYEVIVVDNGSRPGLKPALAAFPQLYTLGEDQPGSYAARNRGVAFGKGQILAFTDSDCIPSSNWIESGVKALMSDPRCGIVGGQISVFPVSSDPGFIEKYSMHVELDQERFVKSRSFAATANMFTYRRVFSDVGRFEASLTSGGDLDFARRVAAAGYAVTYDPGPVVFHPARARILETLRKFARVSSGLYARGAKEFDLLTAARHVQRRHEELTANMRRAGAVLGRGDTAKAYLFVSGAMAVDYYQRLRMSFGGKPVR